MPMTGNEPMNLWQISISRRPITIAAVLVATVSLGIGAHAALNKRALDAARAVASEQGEAAAAEQQPEAEHDAVSQPVDQARNNQRQAGPEYRIESEAGADEDQQMLVIGECRAAGVEDVADHRKCIDPQAEHRAPREILDREQWREQVAGRGLVHILIPSRVVRPAMMDIATPFGNAARCA